MCVVRYDDCLWSLLVTVFTNVSSDNTVVVETSVWTSSSSYEDSTTSYEVNVFKLVNVSKEVEVLTLVTSV